MSERAQQKLPWGIHSFNGFFSVRKFKKPMLQISVKSTEQMMVFTGCVPTKRPILKMKMEKLLYVLLLLSLRDERGRKREKGKKE